MSDGINWSNVDLQRYGDHEIISGKTFDILILEAENLNPATQKTISEHFEKCLRDVVSEAREIFYDNLDNIVAYTNRHAIAEAIETERDEKDRETVQLLAQDLYENRRIWREISQEYFDWMLGCVYPIRQGRGGFVNCEAYSSISEEDVYFVALKGNGVCYAAYGTLAEWDSKALTLTSDIPKW